MLLTKYYRNVIIIHIEVEEKELGISEIKKLYGLVDIALSHLGY
jgi:hypothetical protein